MASWGERLRGLPNRDVSIALALVLALIFANNVFHYSQYRINKVFDQTSEGLVVGRLARSAADGIFSERAELGTNYHERDPVELRGSYSDQIRYFEQPDLIKSDDAQWYVYPSQFGLQGVFFALIDSIDLLPRRYRIGCYHFLSALICAAAFMWVAYRIRERFGFAAATGFVVPVMFEPMTRWRGCAAVSICCGNCLPSRSDASIRRELLILSESHCTLFRIMRSGRISRLGRWW